MSIIWQPSWKSFGISYHQMSIIGNLCLLFLFTNHDVQLKLYYHYSLLPCTQGWKQFTLEHNASIVLRPLR